MGDLLRGQRARLSVPGRHRGAHCDDAAGGLGREPRPELTSFDAFLHYAVKVVHLAITLGEDRAPAWLVEAAQLAVSQEALLLVLCMANDVHADQGPELFCRVIRGSRIRILAAPDQLVHPAVHDREKERLLRRKMVVERSRAHARPLRDITDRRPVITVLRHGIDRRGEQDPRARPVEDGDRRRLPRGHGLGLAAMRRDAPPTSGIAPAARHDGACPWLGSSPSHEWSPQGHARVSGQDHGNRPGSGLAK
jgi:hypothetical protein